MKDLGRRIFGPSLGDLSIVVLWMPGFVSGEYDGVRRGRYSDDSDILRDEVEV